MKKYRLRFLIKHGIRLHIYFDGTKRITSLSHDYAESIGSFVDDLINHSGNQNKNGLIAICVKHAIENTREFSNEELIRIAEEGKETWPIELGLVEEIPEPKLAEPKLVYMDRYEALRLVYEQDKTIAYDNEGWLSKFISVYIRETYDENRFLTSRKDSVGYALAAEYSAKLWFVVGNEA